MAIFKPLVILQVFLFQVRSFDTDLKVLDVPILMPKVQPTHSETYLCTGLEIDQSKERYIIGFRPNATMHVAHHILIYGCSSPGSEERVWNCGEMSLTEDPGFVTAPICKSGSQVVYAWALDAPALQLPHNVGFLIGGNSSIKHLVLQVHYADVSSFLKGNTDESGVILKVTDTPQPKAAGVICMSVGGSIPPMSTEHMETACKMDELKVVHPFAFRAHTHNLGRVVTGYRVRRTWYGKDEWTRIGSKDPLKPQMFYPVEDPSLTVLNDDTLAARCTYVSNRTKTTYIGTTHADEMCNFYIMYWVEGPNTLKQKYCSSEGPPNYYWHLATPSLNNIPLANRRD